MSLNVKGFLIKKGLDPILQGDNYVSNCPFCGETRNRFGVHKDSGKWQCFNCEKKGRTIHSLTKALDGELNTEVMEERNEVNSNVKVDIDQTLSRKYFLNLKKENRNVLNYLKTERGFSEETIKYFELGSKLKNGYEYVTIPYWEKGQIVNMKFRAINFKDKKFKWQRITGGKTALFHDDILDDKSYDEVYVAEAEMDAVSLYNAGMKNVISVTAGAKSFKPEWVNKLERFKKIYLVFDTDKDGIIGVKKMAERLGVDRCYIVNLPKEFKDINEYFYNSKTKKHIHKLSDFKKLVEAARQLEVQDVISLHDALNELKDEITSANEEEIVGLQTPWKSVNKLIKGVKSGHLVVVSAPPKVGKCLRKNTNILMFDGTIKKVQDIKVGEYLMGPDSKPRKVLNLGTGREMMYEITSKYGDTWGCNESHILSLKCSGDVTNKYLNGNIYNLTVKEYLNLPKHIRTRLKLWNAGVDFKDRKVPYDPYWIGLWLGDGTSGQTSINKPCKVLEPYFKDFAKRNSLIYKKYIYNKCPRHTFLINKNFPEFRNPLKFFLKSLIVNNEKGIPKEYLINSRKKRQELLAGLLDTDGYMYPTGPCEITTKFSGLSEDIKYLTRSLGLRITTNDKVVNGVVYKRHLISGDLSELPLKRLKQKTTYKNRSMSFFTIKPIGVERYYGFELDKDHLYLLGDFFVTHNTSFVYQWSQHIARNQDVPTLFYCCEMRPNRLAEKNIAIANPDYEDLGSVKNSHFTAAHFMTSNNIYLGHPNLRKDGNFILEVDYVCKVITEAVRRYGVRFVVFDHLHFLVRGSDTQTLIGEVTRKFKLLAETLNIVFILIAQPKKIGNRMMDTDDLKDSASIFQDCDLAILLHRNKSFNEDPDVKSQEFYDPLTIVKVAGRWCDGGQCDLIFDGKRSLFYDSGSIYNRVRKTYINKRKYKKDLP